MKDILAKLAALESASPKGKTPAKKESKPAASGKKKLTESSLDRARDRDEAWALAQGAKNKQQASHEPGKTSQQRASDRDEAWALAQGAKNKQVAEVEEGIVDRIRAKNYDRLAKRSSDKAIAALDKAHEFDFADENRFAHEDEFMNQMHKRGNRIAKSLKLDPTLGEAKAPYVSKQFPNTRQGVLDFVQTEVQARFVKKLDLETCQIFPDPQFDGVWALDSLAIGARVIIYLGGYGDRPLNDFEQGAMPMSKVRELVQDGDVGAAQLAQWVKNGNLTDKQYATLSEYFDDAMTESVHNADYAPVEVDGVWYVGDDLGNEMLEYGEFDSEEAAHLQLVPSDDPDIAKYFGSDLDEACKIESYNKELTDEGVNHMGDREYQTWNGWKAACKKAYPGCKFIGDRDIGAATIPGRDVGEWDGTVGSVYSKPAGPDVIDEAKAPTLALKIKNSVIADQISKDKEGNYIFRKGYFYRNGLDADKWAARVAKALADAGLAAELVDSYDHWAAFKGGAGVKSNSHFAAIFKITEAQSEVTEGEDKQEDPYSLGMGYYSRALRKQPHPKNPHPEGSVDANRWDDEYELGFNDRTRERCESTEADSNSLVEAKADKVYTVIKTKHSTGKDYAHTGTLAELIKHYSYTLQTGASYQREKGNVKINCNPTNINALIKNLNNAVNNAAANGSAGEDYWLEDEVTESTTVNELDQSTLQSYKQKAVWGSNTANMHGDRATAVKRNKGLANAAKRLPEEPPRELDGAAIQRDYYSSKGGSRYVGDSVARSSNKKINETKIMKPVVIILEGVKFRVRDPMVAKVLRRFPHEAQNFDAGSALDDALFDALYDHYFANGAMPHAVAKGHNGADPYTWVSDKLHKEMTSDLDAAMTEDVNTASDIAAILDKYPHEAKMFKETGELEDGELYQELYDHYLNNGEMPYGIAKARTGDPIQWVTDRLDSDLDSVNESDEELDEELTLAQKTRFASRAPSANIPASNQRMNSTSKFSNGGSNQRVAQQAASLGEDDELVEELTPAQKERMERMKRQDAEFAKVKSSVEAGQRGYVNPFANDTRQHDNDALTWRRDQLAKAGKASGGLAFEGDETNDEYECVYCGKEVPQSCDDPSCFSCCGEVGHVQKREAVEEDSIDHTLADGEVIVEASHADIIEQLTDLGFDEGLDFFFDGEELVVIGRSTARAVINAVGGSIVDMDGEEVRISFKPKAAAIAPSRSEVNQLAAEPEMFESVSLQPGNLGNSGSLATQLGKLAKVIKSVKTEDQLDSAQKMADLVQANYNKDAHNKKSIGAGYKDALATLQAINADLAAKRRELLNAPVTEGKVKEMQQDLKSEKNGGLSDAEFKAQYKKTKEEARKALKENVSVTVDADNEEDMLAVIRRLGGISDTPVTTKLPADITSMMAAIDAIQADDVEVEDFIDPADEVSYNEFDESEEYANEPAPEIQTGLAKSIATAGNEPGRRAYTVGNVVEESKSTKKVDAIKKGMYK